MSVRGSKARSEGAYIRYVTEQSNEADEGDALLSEQKTFCRSVDADPRKQGESGGSVLAHMTDAKDAADEGGAPLGEPKKGERAERRDSGAR